jgi:hypothetical protein
MRWAIWWERAVPRTTTAIRQILPRQREYGVEVPAARHQCRYFGTLCHSNLRLKQSRDVPT